MRCPNGTYDNEYHVNEAHWRITNPTSKILISGKKYAVIGVKNTQPKYTAAVILLFLLVIFLNCRLNPTKNNVAHSDVKLPIE